MGVRWATRVLGISVIGLYAGCSSGGQGGNRGIGWTDPNDDSHGGTGGTGSASGGAPNNPNAAQECTIAHCDCSYCDFNPDYKCVDNCVATCGNKEVGYRCNGGSDCTSVQTNSSNCGSCGHRCEGGQQCSQGKCTSTSGTGGTGPIGSAGTGSSGIAGSGSAGTSAAGGAVGTGGTGAAGTGSGVAGSGTAGSSASGGGTAADPCHIVPGVFEGGALGYLCGANLPLSICKPGPTPGTTTCSTPPANRLYLCSDSQTVGYVTCAAGCYAAPPGQPDYCLDSDPCANTPLDGDSCGDNLSPLADPNVLYTCQDGVTIASTVCAGGCVAAPLGYADVCAPVEQGSD